MIGNREILTPNTNEQHDKPKIMKGYMSKRRKWPLKGWHDRFFYLEEGVLIYGKNEGDVNRGKINGKMSIGSAVISAMSEAFIIDINEEDNIFHLKANNAIEYGSWLESMQQHQQYQMNLIEKRLHGIEDIDNDDELQTCEYIQRPNGKLSHFLTKNISEKVGSGNDILIEFSKMDDSLMKDLLELQTNIVDIELFVQKLEEDTSFKCNSRTKGSKSKPWKLLTIGRKQPLQVPEKVDTHNIISESIARSTQFVINGNNDTNNNIGEKKIQHNGEKSSCDWVKNGIPSQHSINSLQTDTTAPLNHNHNNQFESLSPDSVTTLPKSRSENNTPSPSSRSRRTSFGEYYAKSNSNSCSNLGASALQSCSSNDIPQKEPSNNEISRVASLSVNMHANLDNLIRKYTADKEIFKTIISKRNAQIGKEPIVRLSTATPVNKYATLGGIGSNAMYQCNNQQYLQALSLITALRKNLSQVIDQNAALSATLQSIHLKSDTKSIPNLPADVEALLNCPIGQIPSRYSTLSHPKLDFSVCSSAQSNSQFFDAREYASDLERDSDLASSEDDEEGKDKILNENINRSTDSIKILNDSKLHDISSENLTLVDTESSVLYANNHHSSSPKSNEAVQPEDIGSQSSSPTSNYSENANQLYIKNRSEYGKGSFGSTCHTGRRLRLPASQCSASGISLLNLMRKNIGKDLSKISMPVALNEPLSILQRLCEELEYSELLDRAVVTEDRMGRMVLVAAFAISAYSSVASPFRASRKPFNPMLGETYECHREDKGFRYVAEQVSHHPPITACYASSEDGSWKWWQDFRVKTKFWGKSMEFQPEGAICLEIIPKKDQEREDNRANENNQCNSTITSELYTWNKVTTCIHNLFGIGSLWADVYGDSTIKCYERSIQPKKDLKDDNDNSENNASYLELASMHLLEEHTPTMTCKLEFLSASSGSYWQTNKRQPHEVQGTIYDENGKHIQQLFGKCTEAIYCGRVLSARCVWRLGALPEDAHMNYGFSRFAIELNEILSHERNLLPHTDTRYRPDQRCLEEGLIKEAENLKLKLEQSQRERKLQVENNHTAHVPMWFKKLPSSNVKNFCNCISWVFRDDYWKIRAKEGGFERFFNGDTDPATKYLTPKLW